MMTPESRGRSGWTLVEILVVLSIVGLLLALLLPAVQSARESARRVTCQDRLRQVGLALQSHAAATGALPSLYNGTFLPMPRWTWDEFRFHSWRTTILPGIEQSALFAAINFNLPATAPANQTTANVRLAAFVCPSTPDTDRPVPEFAVGDGVWPALLMSVGTAAKSDYEAAGGVQVARQTRMSSYLDIYEFGAWGEPTYKVPTGYSASYRKPILSDISDGLSNTLLVVERAGRPDLYQKGKPVEWYRSDTNPPRGLDPPSATWAISSHFLWYICVRTIPGYPQQFVNDNNRGIFAFHPGGANVAMADGSVRFLKDTTAPAVLKALVTRAGAEVAAPE